MFQKFCVQIFRTEYEPLRCEKFRADIGQQKAFQIHAVILKEPSQSKGKGGQNTHPADLHTAQHGTQAEISADCYGDRQQRKEELAQG